MGEYNYLGDDGNGFNIPQTINFMKNKYKLYAYTLKSGSKSSGHYTCNIRNKAGWYHIDDTNPKVIKNITKELKDDSIKNTFNESYITLLFYMKDSIHFSNLEIKSYKNERNLCFLHSILQCLLHTPKFVENIKIMKRWKEYPEEKRISLLLMSLNSLF